MQKNLPPLNYLFALPEGQFLAEGHDFNAANAEFSKYLQGKVSAVTPISLTIVRGGIFTPMRTWLLANHNGTAH
jgi:hypothetical protein